MLSEIGNGIQKNCYPDLKINNGVYQCMVWNICLSEILNNVIFKILAYYIFSY